jgi:hypothetical protein
MKNMAHFTYENECFAQIITDVTQRTGMNFQATHSNIDKSFDVYSQGGNDVKFSGMSKAI